MARRESSPEASDVARRRQELRASLVERFPRERTYLLPALHYLQEESGYLPGWALEVLGWHLRIPASEVYGAATSYTELRVRETGQHVLRVCTGLGCWLNGGREILERLTDTLGISPGETTGDALVTLEETPCGFLCGMAPAVQWNGRWHGRMGPDEVADMVLDTFRGRDKP
jgi:NADH:ubiquinone oxidoreductase subunit E